MSEYDIITSTMRHDGADDLAAMVRDRMARGWQPIGGVCVSVTENEMYGVRWAQAMIRTTPHQPNATDAGEKGAG